MTAANAIFTTIQKPLQTNAIRRGFTAKSVILFINCFKIVLFQKLKSLNRAITYNNVKCFNTFLILFPV